jgi:2,3-bisphosphoglycerate-dependent phosphoglycerate mutase
MNGPIVLVKHALPVRDPAKPPREWQLGEEGRHQSRLLAQRLRRFLPLRLIASIEAKAIDTARIVADELEVALSVMDGFEEIDRPALPVMTRAEHQRLNEAIFADPDRPALGTESARAALERFSVAVHQQVAQTDDQSVVIVTHGTVISLLVAAHNHMPAFELWRRLSCPSFVVLERQSLAVREIIEDAAAAVTHSARENEADSNRYLIPDRF